MQHIAHAQRAPRMPAEAAERESRFRAEIVRHVKPAGDCEISPQSGPGYASKLQHSACLDGMRLPECQRLAVERRVHRRTGERDHRVEVELQHRACGRALQRRGALVVIQQPVRQTQRERVHRPGRRHADVPVAEPARPIL